MGGQCVYTFTCYSPYRLKPVWIRIYSLFTLHTQSSLYTYLQVIHHTDQGQSEHIFTAYSPYRPRQMLSFHSQALHLATAMPGRQSWATAVLCIQQCCAVPSTRHTECPPTAPRGLWQLFGGATISGGPQQLCQCRYAARGLSQDTQWHGALCGGCGGTSALSHDTAGTPS